MTSCVPPTLVVVIQTLWVLDDADTRNICRPDNLQASSSWGCISRTLPAAPTGLGRSAQPTNILNVLATGTEFHILGQNKACEACNISRQLRLLFHTRSCHWSSARSMGNVCAGQQICSSFPVTFQKIRFHFSGFEGILWELRQSGLVNSVFSSVRYDQWQMAVQLHL